MKFNYKKYGIDTLRPVIEIKVISGSRELRYHTLVDSGADICVFHSEVGEALGIDIKKGKMSVVTGVGGKDSHCYMHKVKINVGGWEHETEVAFIPNVGNIFSPYGIVGQKGFFENFVVKFDLSKKEIELKNK